MATMRVADYIAKRLAEAGLTTVFMVTGGGAMHLNDAFGRNKQLRVVCCHHEQACAIAAEGYARVSGRPAVVNVTTGPGGTNAITGVWGAFTDSVPMVVISGQVKFETTVRATGLPLRQLGDQEIDITRIVEPFCKYSVMITEPSEVRLHIERALHLAVNGRPGPVWLDVPMNVQSAQIDPECLVGYDPFEAPREGDTQNLESVCRELLVRMAQSERPVVIAGQGVRASGSHSAFVRTIEALGVPVTVSFNALDVLPDSHPLFVGRQGTIGDRAGNFAVQNSDFLLILGCRLSIRQVSYSWQNFARAAFKAMVDIDLAELRKPTLSIDLPVHADLSDALPLLEKIPFTRPRWSDWLERCHAWKKRYPVVLDAYWQTQNAVNPYCFMQSLFSSLPPGSIVVTGDGTASVTSFQAASLKENSRLFHNSGSAPMGFDLPAAVGAAIASGGPVICLAGDGSIQMNLQELQTIVTQGLDVKIFLLNNNGYHSIRQTQHNYFSDNIVGCGTESGLGFPSFERLSGVYGLPYHRANSHQDLGEAIARTLAAPTAALCEIVLDLGQVFAPKLASRKLDDGRMVSSPLEDLAPFLSREELRENMLIPLVEA